MAFQLTLDAWKIELSFVISQSLTSCCKLRKRRTHHEESRALGWSALNHWCALPLVPPSWIDRNGIIADKTPPCMPRWSLSLLEMLELIIQNWVKKSTLKELFHASPCHHGWFSLTSSCDLQSILPCGCPSLEFVSHEVDMPLLGDISRVEELLHFVNSVLKGLYIKVLTKRKNLNLHPIFIRTWVFAFPTSIRLRKSASPVKVLKSASPILIRISDLRCRS